LELLGVLVEYNIKMELKWLGWGRGVEWIDISQVAGFCYQVPTNVVI
jgi:hypothetical protein